MNRDISLALLILEIIKQGIRSSILELYQLYEKALKRIDIYKFWNFFGMIWDMTRMRITYSCESTKKGCRYSLSFTKYNMHLWKAAGYNNQIVGIKARIVTDEN